MCVITDVFHVDPEFEKNETLWAEIKKEILGESEESGSESGSESDSEGEEEENNEQIMDYSETDLTNLRRTVSRISICLFSLQKE